MGKLVLNLPKLEMEMCVACSREKHTFKGRGKSHTLRKVFAEFKFSLILNDPHDDSLTKHQ